MSPAVRSVSSAVELRVNIAALALLIGRDYDDREDEEGTKAGHAETEPILIRSKRFGQRRCRATAVRMAR